MTSFWPFSRRVRRTRSTSMWSMSGRLKSTKNISAEDISAHQFFGETKSPTTSQQNIFWTRAVVSKSAPQWEGTAVIKGSIKDLKLTDFRGKYLVFFFYPLAFTYVCPTEILAFNARLSEFHSIGAEIVACSVDSPHAVLAWLNVPREEGGIGGPINLPLLTDTTHRITKEYGVYMEDSGHSLRGLFIIDDKGVIRHMSVNDLPVGRSVNETLRLVQAFQATDKQNELCPVDWTPGSETIIPDIKEKLKFFRARNRQSDSLSEK